MDINTRIRNLRIDNDKSQKEIADVLNIERKTYLRYEKGEHEIKINAIITLAKFYNVSIDYIIGLTDEEKPFYEYRNNKLTKKEIKILEAYKANTEFQKTVDKLLDIN